MKYVERLLRDETYLELLQELEATEAERIYCRHGFAHLMDVARLAWIYALEENCEVSREQVYLTALLHDIGRVEEYTNGISHARAGQRLAGEILLRIGYPKEQIPEMLAAVGAHRQTEAEAGNIPEEKRVSTELSELLRRADKSSRPCFLCPAASSCKWSIEKRNTPENWM